MMTNDKELIKKMTGLDIGKVWLKNSKINSELYDDEQILFDTRRGNFHMLPKDTLVVEKAIQGINFSANSSALNSSLLFILLEIFTI